ncbi:hypothetical protein M885DRAFT_424223, partial [Pelagophyceae sp. CCMP2097]
GSLLWFNDTKQYGFIVPEQGGENVFVHGRDIYAPVRKGQRVAYDVSCDVA